MALETERYDQFQNPHLDLISQFLLSAVSLRNQHLREIKLQIRQLATKLTRYNSTYVDTQLKLINRSKESKFYEHYFERITWQQIKRSFRLSFASWDPNDENNNLDEIKVACQACFLSDLVDANQIVFCDSCEIGVHQKCYGITDLEPQFLCQKCTDLRNDLSVGSGGRLSINRE